MKCAKDFIFYQISDNIQSFMSSLDPPPFPIIPMPPEEDDEDEEINGVIIETGSEEIPAKMYRKGIEIFIKTCYGDVRKSKIINIRLVGVLELKIFPAPICFNLDTNDFEAPTMPATILITYLTDVFDKGSISSIFFSGIRGILEIFLRKIEIIISSMKKNVEFISPDPNKTRKRSESLPKRKKIATFKLFGKPKIIKLAEIEAIRLFMPMRYRSMSWNLQYQMSEDGVSLNTLMTKCEKKKPIVLLILTDKHVKLGAFLSEGIQKNKKGFYGTGETFVFNFDPLFIGYKWSYTNQCFVSTTSTDLMIGQSAKGGAAIYFDNNMLIGYSDACETFNSPPLTGKHSFKIIDVEAWSMVVK